MNKNKKETLALAQLAAHFQSSRLCDGGYAGSYLPSPGQPLRGKTPPPQLQKQSTSPKNKGYLTTGLKLRAKFSLQGLSVKPLDLQYYRLKKIFFKEQLTDIM